MKFKELVNLAVNTESYNRLKQFYKLDILCIFVGTDNEYLLRKYISHKGSLDIIFIVKSRGIKSKPPKKIIENVSGLQVVYYTYFISDSPASFNKQITSQIYSSFLTLNDFNFINKIYMNQILNNFINNSEYKKLAALISAESIYSKLILSQETLLLATTTVSTCLFKNNGQDLYKLALSVIYLTNRQIESNTWLSTFKTQLETNSINKETWSEFKKLLSIYKSYRKENNVDLEKCSSQVSSIWQNKILG